MPVADAPKHGQRPQESGQDARLETRGAEQAAPVGTGTRGRGQTAEPAAHHDRLTDVERPDRFSGLPPDGRVPTLLDAQGATG